MPNRLRAFRGRVPAESLFCACQRHGGRSYAQKEQRPPCRKIVLKLPDLDHAKSAVLNSLSSPIQGETTSSQWSSSSPWYCSEPRLALNRAVVLRFRLYLETLGLAAGTVNQCLAAVRRLAYEAADSGLLSPELAAGIRRVKSVMQLGARSGNWLIQDQSRLLLEKARRDFDAAPSAVRNPANSPKSADWSGLLFHTRCRTQGLPNCVGIG
jgi:hypothetical protein